MNPRMIAFATVALLASGGIVSMASAEEEPLPGNDDDNWFLNTQRGCDIVEFCEKCGEACEQTGMSECYQSWWGRCICRCHPKAGDLTAVMGARLPLPDDS